MGRSYGWLIAAVAWPLLGAGEPPGTSTTPLCHVEVKAATPPAATALLAGYGTGGFAVSTAEPQAQAYFDNGMQLAHAFAHKAAIGAFERAEQLDPTCAMCVWGEAWSRGPTINYPIERPEQKELAALTDKAAILGARAPPKERALIAALQKRYRNGDLAFARAMDDLAKSTPADDEIAVIAADAWMINAGRHDSRDHLDRALALLKTVLDRHPTDTGAIHFYIHATEMDGHGVDALPYAATLQGLAPAASHLVHMPSHTYFWAGRYRLAEQANLDAVEIDKANALRLKPKDGVFGLSYHGHNVQFGEGAGLLDGDAKGAMSLASPNVARLPMIKPTEIFRQVGLGTSYFVYGRYASPAEMAALPNPGTALPYAQAMWFYAQGEAAARAGEALAVKAQAAAIRALPRRYGGFQDFPRFGPQAQCMVDIAALVLDGRAAMLERRWRDAQSAFRRGAELQEARLGDFSDPPIWWYPIRRSLAAALLADGNPAEAESQVRRALVLWPYDPLSLRVSADLQSARGHADEARRQLDFAHANWIGDVSLMPPALI